MKPIIGWMQRLLGREPWCVRWAVKVRNQAEVLIEIGLSPHLWDSARNGEHLLLSRLAGSIRRFVDVGANVGEWTQHLISHVAPDAEGLLIEPNPGAVDVLRRRFAGWNKIEILPMALSDRVGCSSLFLCDASAGCSLVAGALPGAPTVDVVTETLDRLISQRGWDHVDFLKIDAEGHDLDVLRGAGGLLGIRAIGFVQFEYMQSWALNGSALGGAIGMLRSAGYETRLLTPKGPIPFDYGFYREFFRYANFVAATRERWAEFDGGTR